MKRGGYSRIAFCKSARGLCGRGAELTEVLRRRQVLVSVAWESAPGVIVERSIPKTDMGYIYFCISVFKMADRDEEGDGNNRACSVENC